jgi:tetratricopeptide (TPR) repeat protein
MIAIFKSWPGSEAGTAPSQFLKVLVVGRCRVLLALLLSLTGLAHAAAEDSDSVSQKRAVHFQMSYRQSVEKYKTNQNYESSWKLALACFEWAEFATKDSDRSGLAQEGIDAAQKAIRLDPKRGEGYHYLAMNLGQLARTRKLSALKLVDDMEENFLKAIELQPKLDYASPHRSLGLLYRDAPGWPVSVGNKGKARLHLQKAVELCPEFPENHLVLLETYLKAGDFKSATSAVAAAEKCLNDAPKQFSGPDWELSWQDWRARWDKMKEKMASGPKNIRSPKQQA